jgi:hypothetical protein
MNNPSQNYLDDKFKDAETGGACGNYGGQQRYIQGFVEKRQLLGFGRRWEGNRKMSLK